MKKLLGLFCSVVAFGAISTAVYTHNVVGGNQSIPQTQVYVNGHMPYAGFYRLSYSVGCIYPGWGQLDGSGTFIIQTVTRNNIWSPTPDSFSCNGGNGNGVIGKSVVVYTDGTQWGSCIGLCFTMPVGGFNNDRYAMSVTVEQLQ